MFQHNTIIGTDSISNSDAFFQNLKIHLPWVQRSCLVRVIICHKSDCIYLHLAFMFYTDFYDHFILYSMYNIPTKIITDEKYSTWLSNAHLDKVKKKKVWKCLLWRKIQVILSIHSECCEVEWGLSKRKDSNFRRQHLSS